MGKFEILRGMDGHYYFVLKADNGLALVMSQAYASRRGVEQAIESVRRLAVSAKVENKCGDEGKTRLG
jgi:uncharacterized protein YegP (UPF0339 family)